MRRLEKLSILIFLAEMHRPEKTFTDMKSDFLLILVDFRVNIDCDDLFPSGKR